MSRLETQGNDTLNTDLIAVEDGRLVLAGNIVHEDMSCLGEVRDVEHTGRTLSTGEVLNVGDVLILNVKSVPTSTFAMDFASVTEVVKTSGTESSSTTAPRFENYWTGANNALYTGSTKITNFIGTCKVVIKSATTVPANFATTNVYFSTESYTSKDFLPYLKWEDDELKVLKDDNTYGTISVS